MRGNCRQIGNLLLHLHQQVHLFALQDVKLLERRRIAGAAAVGGAIILAVSGYRAKLCAKLTVWFGRQGRGGPHARPVKIAAACQVVLGECLWLIGRFVGAGVDQNDFQRGFLENAACALRFGNMHGQKAQMQHQRNARGNAHRRDAPGCWGGRGVRQGRSACHGQVQQAVGYGILGLVVACGLQNERRGGLH